MPQGAREIDGQLGFNAQSPAKVISGRSVRGKSIMTGSRKKKKKKKKIAGKNITASSDKKCCTSYIIRISYSLDNANKNTSDDMSSVTSHIYIYII